jgi:hypothetical protein
VVRFEESISGRSKRNRGVRPEQEHDARFQEQRADVERDFLLGPAPGEIRGVGSGSVLPVPDAAGRRTVETLAQGSSPVRRVDGCRIPGGHLIILPRSGVLARFRPLWSLNPESTKSPGVARFAGPSVQGSGSRPGGALGGPRPRNQPQSPHPLVFKRLRRPSDSDSPMGDFPTFLREPYIFPLDATPRVGDRYGEKTPVRGFPYSFPMIFSLSKNSLNGHSIPFRGGPPPSATEPMAR